MTNIEIVSPLRLGQQKGKYCVPVMVCAECGEPITLEEQGAIMLSAQRDSRGRGFAVILHRGRCMQGYYKRSDITVVETYPLNQYLWDMFLMSDWVAVLSDLPNCFWDRFILSRTVRLITLNSAQV